MSHIISVMKGYIALGCGVPTEKINMAEESQIMNQMRLQNTVIVGMTVIIMFALK